MECGSDLSCRDCQTLLDNIPGGVMQCLNDKFLTMLEANQGLQSMVEYSRKEMTEQFNGRFIEMIHPLDREELQKKLRERCKAEKQLSHSFRVLCKDGRYKWIIAYIRPNVCKDGQERLFFILHDISESRDSEEELRLSLERHKIIMDQATDIIFEWDMVRDSILYSPNWKKKFGYSPYYEGIGERELMFRNIHPEDITKLIELMNGAKGGKSYSSGEIRIQDSRGQYIWCRIRATNQYDAAGKTVKAVGIITDIDKEKRMLDDLRRRAERDALTGLYNREETSAQIRNYLKSSPPGYSVLFMIDTDNFKQVNDTQGHLFGDAVLTELAAGMKKLANDDDVVGRIGGDEFTVFLKHVSTRQEVEDNAKQLLDTFRHLFEQEKNAVKITCSIGAAMYPDDGNNFQSLYQCSDQALYQAKNMGKNRFVLYDKSKAVPLGMPGYSSLGAAIDSDRSNAGASGDLVSYVFQILYDTAEMERAIQLILEIVGKRFDVSRAYIFENTEDGRYCNNTYEWCGEGIIPQKEYLQHMAYADFEQYDELFLEENVFYCRDISVLPTAQMELFKAQGICATLQCAIRDEEEFCGFVGFDECTGVRLWTKEEIGILTLISQLITTFLQKKRVKERDKQTAIRLKTILDVQDAYIYAIEQQSYELLYLNRKTKELDPNAKKGMTCYQAFFKRESPCETCPLYSNGISEIHNPNYDVWTKVQSATMKWGDTDAYLLSCYDITEYKKLLEQQ